MVFLGQNFCRLCLNVLLEAMGNLLPMPGARLDWPSDRGIGGPMVLKHAAREHRGLRLMQTVCLRYGASVGLDDDW